MFGWRIRGRWEAQGSSDEPTFVIGTKTENPEERAARALAVLCGLGIGRVPTAEKMTAEILETEELGWIRGGVTAGVVD